MKTIERRRRRALRYALIAASAVLGLLAAALVTSPLWLTPLLQSARPALERAVSRAVGAPVRIADIRARIGWRPGFTARGVRVGSRARPAVRVRGARVDLSWLALAEGRVRPAFIALTGAHLTVLKTARGFQVAGLPTTSPRQAHWRAFLRQEPALAITDSDLTILDDHKRLALRGLAAQWLRGLRRHTLKGQAAIPGVCADCRVSAVFAHWPSRPQAFVGHIGVQARSLRLHALAALTGRPALKALAGRASGRLWLSLRHGTPEFLSGQLRLTGLVLPATAHNRESRIPALSGDFSFARGARGWRFYGVHWRGRIAGRPVRTGAVFLAHHGQRWRARIQDLDLHQAAALVGHARGLPAALARLAALRPRGRLRDLRARARKARHWHYRLHTRFSGLAVRAGGRGPRFSGASGAITLDGHSGRLVLTGLHGIVRIPRLVPAPLAVERASATVTWQRAANGMSWQVPRLRLATAAGAMTGAVSLVRVTGKSPVVLLAARLSDVDLAKLRALYPRALRARLRRSLVHTIRGGLVTRGRVVVKGPADAFPFRHANGVFRADLSVQGGRYRFARRWPCARDLDIRVQARNAHLSVQGSGRLGKVALSHFAVAAGPLGTRTGQAVVHLAGTGGLGSVLALVLPHVRAPLRQALPATITGHGPMSLTLALRVPFARKAKLALNGSLALEGASLRYPLGHGALGFHALDGRIGFTQAGPTAGTMHGTLAGGPWTLALKTQGGVLMAQAHGTVKARLLRPLTGPGTRYLTGVVPWQLRVRRAHRTHLRARADLKEAALRLPYPAGKGAGVPGVLRLKATIGRHASVFEAALPHHLAALYRAVPGRPVAAWLGIGSARPPKRLASGLSIGVRSGYLDARPWLAFLQGLVHGQGRALARLPAQGLQPKALTLYVGSGVFGGYTLGPVRADFVRAGQDWSGRLAGPDTLGRVRWQPRGHGVLSLDFQRLVIPPRARHHALGQAVSQDPRRLPVVHFQADRLVVAGHDFGRVAIRTAGIPDGLRFTRILVARGHTLLSANGRWTVHGGRQESVMTGYLHSANLGHTLAQWGVPDQVAGGRTRVRMALNWPGGPTAFSFHHLDGTLTFLVGSGRFVQVRQGAGKLLGIFNIDAIARYLTFNFSNIFGRGFSFNHIGGRVLIENGRALTHGIHVDGASANVRVSGEAGLARKRFDLLVKVEPHIAGNVTLATGLIGGPIAGAAALLMQKIFAGAISNTTSISYRIVGPWKSPIIRTVGDRH